MSPLSSMAIPVRPSHTLLDPTGATIGRIEIMESFGVITVQSSRVSGPCAARDYVIAQYPVINVYFATGTVQATLVNK
jgi:uncharacterized membrane protein YeiH